MAEALILDSEAVNALARPTERKALAARASAVLRLAYERRALVRVPAPVVAEVCRGVRSNSAMNHLLNSPGVGVFELNRAIAQQAGHLLARLKLSSTRAVDAFVVATASQFETAVIATGDAGDIRKLAAPSGRVGILALKTRRLSKALQQTGLSVATLPLAPAAERRYVGRTNADRDAKRKG